MAEIARTNEGSATEEVIRCKIGVVASASVATLMHLDGVACQAAMGMIHASSGLGLLRLDGREVMNSVLAMRSQCESQGGFLTVLAAPVLLKQQLDVWGYTGNALDLMHRVKQQFDPENILSPDRFVAGV